VSRTIKTDQPPLKMTPEGGRLVPATEYDAERLDTFRRGSTLNVFITHEKQRVDEKKWWAAINRAVKECSTPWQKSAQASEAIKLSLGIVNYSKTVGGQFMQYPKSLTELDDADLADAVRGLFDVLYGVTGVDPEEWRKQVAGIRADPDDEPNPSEAPPPGSDDSGGEGQTEAGDCLAALPSPPADGELEIEPPAGETIRSTQDGLMESEPVTGQSPVGSDSPDVRALKLECLGKFLAAATDAELTVQERRANLEIAKDAWKGQAPDDFVKACLTMADKVAKSELKADAARKYLESLL
jgi:hypothetical protein